MLHEVFHDFTEHYLRVYHVIRRCGLQERFYFVNRNEDRFAVAVMSHDDIVGHIPSHLVLHPALR